MSPPEPRKEELSAAPVGTEVLGRDATDQKESLATEKYRIGGGEPVGCGIGRE